MSAIFPKWTNRLPLMIAVGLVFVGGGVLAVDIIEHPEKGFLVNEINHTLEFHTAQPTSGVDIAGVIVDYVIQVAECRMQKSECK